MPAGSHMNDIAIQEVAAKSLAAADQGAPLAQLEARIQALEAENATMAAELASLKAVLAAAATK